MKKIWIAICAILLLAAAVYIAAVYLVVSSPMADRPAAAAYHKITAEQAKAMMDDGAPYILLDVRTQGEFAENHIKGAVLIPDTELQTRAPAELPDKSARILVYCRSGKRSEASVNMLAGMGYANVHDFGGILDWKFGTVWQ